MELKKRKKSKRWGQTFLSKTGGYPTKDRPGVMCYQRGPDLQGTVGVCNQTRNATRIKKKGGVGVFYKKVLGETKSGGENPGWVIWQRDTYRSHKASKPQNLLKRQQGPGPTRQEGC